MYYKREKELILSQKSIISLRVILLKIAKLSPFPPSRNEILWYLLFNLRMCYFRQFYFQSNKIDENGNFYVMDI